MERTILSTKHLFSALEANPDRPSFSTVKRWVEGKQEMPAWALEEVARLLGIKKEAAPSMTRRLLAGVIALENRAEITPEERIQAEEDVDAWERLARESDRLAAEHLAKTQRKSGGRPPDQAGGQSGASLGSKRQKKK